MVPFDFPTHSPFQMTPSTCPISWLEMTAFSLSENMQKPYGHGVLTRDESILNYRLSRTRTRSIRKCIWDFGQPIPGTVKFRY
ncbi:hypothetical protein DPMN_091846 [Dreissena polymorpha]|uniref:Uncharacterized protein n=1 Tax=Dreissena polymorpha TaxID=45954 RepID=A0A9D4L191_DREPO|nr:hypothetical protein DPMN_091846 [Dreissena polymorpha]